MEKIERLTVEQEGREFLLAHDVPRLPRIEIQSDSLNVSGNDIIGLNTSKNSVPVSITFISNEKAFTDTGEIAYQGQSSLMDAKKGFTLTFSEKRRMKDGWEEFDEYHLKGYYNDWMHTRDTISNILYEQMLQTRLTNIRPYCKYNDFDALDVDIATDSNKLCHTDDFKCELYINKSYWGLYSFRLKKDRANYKLNKSNNKHIMLDPASYFDTNLGSFPWTAIEVRNPKIKKDIVGNDYNGDAPTEIPNGEVHSAIDTFYEHLRTLSSATKESIIEWLNIDAYIDHLLLVEFTCNPDCYGRNTLWATWDAIHWSPLPYDLNWSFGAYGTSLVLEDNMMAANTNIFSNGNAQRWAGACSKINSFFTDEIKERYKELRDYGIFSVSNVINLHKDIVKEVGGTVYADDVERWKQLGAGYNDRGWIRDMAKIKDFMVGRVAYCDNKFGYNS